MSDLVKRLRDAANKSVMDFGEHWNLEDEAADAIERKDAAIAELVHSGRAIIARWHSPLWKDAKHTGEYIAELQAVCDKHEK